MYGCFPEILNRSLWFLQVNEWYEWYEMEHNDKEVKRRVFIATDEPSVLKEAKASYVKCCCMATGKSIVCTCMWF